jgi:hypothetical protein
MGKNYVVVRSLLARRTTLAKDYIAATRFGLMEKGKRGGGRVCC